jgi:hypothetical protein
MCPSFVACLKDGIESAFARHVLNIQLGAVALLNTSEEGKTEMDIVFNDSALAGSHSFHQLNPVANQCGQTTVMP